MNNPIRQSKSCYEEGTVDMVAFKQRLEKRVQGKGKGRVVGRWASRRKFVLTTITAVIFSGCILVSGYPSIANWFITLTDRTILDPGITSAAREGYSVNIDTAVTDKNITLHIVDVLADSTRLVLSYYVERDGRKFADLLHGDLSVTDSTGRILTSNYSSWQRNDAGDYGYISFALPESPEELNIRLTINKIQIPGTGLNPHQYLHGKWNITIPVNISSSKSATTTYKVSQNMDFSLPQGDSFALKQITFSPSMTRFEFDSTTQRILSFDYTIRDREGNIILMNDAKNSHDNTLSYAPNPQHQINTHDTKYFINIDPLTPNRDYAFQATGVWIVEPVNYTFPINRKMMKEQPIMKKYEETLFQIKSFTLEKDNNQDAFAAKLQIYADRITHSYFDGLRKWELVDDEGKRYPMKALIDSPIGLKRADQGEYYELNQSITFDNLPKNSDEKQFTLVLSSFPHYYNLDWEVPFSVSKD